MMYTRSYYAEDDGISIPKNYDGNAFNDSGGEVSLGVGIPRSVSEVTKISPRESIAEERDTYVPEAEEAISTATGESAIASPFKGLSIGKLLPDSLRSLFKFDSFHIGTEEILIIATALFLFLSRDGDRECAVILLLLLIVN